MKLPKVLIFTPIYEAKDYCLDMFIKHCKQINYPNYKHIFIDNSKGMKYTTKLQGKGLEAYHITRGSNSREALARSQVFARQLALKEGYDYMFSLESDIMIPDGNILQRFIATNKKVISGLYFIGPHGTQIPCITLPEFDDSLGAWGTRLLKQEEIPHYIGNGIQQVQAAGMGCCLISKEVFEKISFFYDPRFMSHSDVYFFNNCFESKITVWVDTNYVCEHENSDWTKVEDR
jgi:hypothetical protein